MTFLNVNTRNARNMPRYALCANRRFVEASKKFSLVREQGGGVTHFRIVD
jgi:hypothetical protein